MLNMRAIFSLFVALSLVVSVIAPCRAANQISDNSPVIQTASANNQVKFLGRFTEHMGAVNCVAFSPDGKTAASGSDDNTVRLWDLRTFKQIQTLTEPSGAVCGVCFSPDGKLLACASHDHRVRVWDIASGNQIYVFDCGIEAHTVAISPDSNWLVAGTYSGSRLWNLNTGQEVTAYSRDDLGDYAVAWSPDGNILAAGGYNSVVKIWSMTQQRFIQNFRLNGAQIHAMAFTSDGHYLICGTDHGDLVQCDVITGQKVRFFNTSGKLIYVMGVAVTPDGSEMLSAENDKTLRIWSLNTGQELEILNGHTLGVSAVAVSSDGQFVLSGSADGTAALWQLPKGRVIADHRTAFSSPTTVTIQQIPQTNNNTQVLANNGPVVDVGPNINAAPNTNISPNVQNGTPPSTNLPADSDSIFRPEYQNTQKSFGQIQSEIHGLVVSPLDNGDMVGQTMDIIATVMNVQGYGGSQVIFDDNQIGSDMRQSLQEAAQAVHLRYPIWQNGTVHISFGDQYSPKDGGSAGGAFAILMLSILENFNIDSNFAMTGELTIDWKLRAIGGVGAKIQGAIDGGCKAVIIPQSNLQEFYDAMLLDGPDTAWKIQIFAEPNLQHAEMLIRTDRPQNLQQAMDLFSTVQDEFQNKGDDVIYNPQVIGELKQVLVLDPDLESAQYLLLKSQGKQPTKLSETASMYEAFVDVYPVLDNLMNGNDSIDRTNLPFQLVNKMRQSLGRLRGISSINTLSLVDSLIDYVNVCDAVASGGANPRALDNQRNAVMGEMDSLQMDHDLMQKMLQQGI